ncbi:MAG: hypothetical protein NTW20_12335 [Rhodobacterales bacterium]|nr:hypothetical protein [Rhodobacterales bacterium]
MTASTRTPGSVIWSLLVAMLNATLILVALCLWLGWHVMSEARAITDRLADGMALLTPVTDELAGLRAEVAGLRGDLASLPGQAAGSAALTAFGDRLAALDSRLTTTGDRIDAMTADPGALIDRAVDRAALQIKSGIAACTPPNT